MPDQGGVKVVHLRLLAGIWPRETKAFRRTVQNWRNLPELAERPGPASSAGV